MNKINRKFVFTKALYILLWAIFGLQCFCITMYTIDSFIENDWLPVGFLYDGCVWDYVKAVALLILTLSFKKEEDHGLQE